MLRKSLISLVFGVSALVASPPVPAQEIASEVSLPSDLDSEVRTAIEQLDDPDWRIREAASSRLLELAPRWRREIPAAWTPASAEAAWRWQRVTDFVAELSDLPTTLRQVPDLGRETRLTRLRVETGTAFLDALVDCLAHPDTRVRSRAVTLLGSTLRGVARLKIHAPTDDPSARVRESLFEVARRSDRDWALSLIGETLRAEESGPLLSIAARAAKGLGDPRLLPLLRERFRSTDDPHPEVILALVAFGRSEDSAALDVLLRSPEYRHVSAALDALSGSRLRDHRASVVPLLASEHWDLRVRALRRLEEHDDGELAYHLLCLLDHDDLDVYSFAVESLVRIGGEDFLGDIELSLERWSLAERPFLISSEEGRAYPRPVPALGEIEGEPVRAILRLRAAATAAGNAAENTGAAPADEAPSDD